MEDMFKYIETLSLTKGKGIRLFNELCDEVKQFKESMESREPLPPRRANSNMSQGSMLSRSSTQSNTNDSSTGNEHFDQDEEDEIRDLTGQVNHHHHHESLNSRGGSVGRMHNQKNHQVLRL